jgi:hypothetical protein
MGGGLASALLSDALTEDGAAREVVGDVGPAGEDGPPGPVVFSVYVDTFYGAELADDLSVVPTENEDPALGPDGDALAYTVVIPANFEGTNPINMRLLLYRTGPCDGNCLIFSIDARRYQLGASGPECLGGEEPDCSDATRWIRVEGPCAAGAAEAEEFLVVDLPLADNGLEFGEVAPGDVLAFELNTFMDDGGTYSVLGVEYSDALAEPVASAGVHMSSAAAVEACAP